MKSRKCIENVFVRQAFLTKSVSYITINLHLLTSFKVDGRLTNTTEHYKQSQ